MKMYKKIITVTILFTVVTGGFLQAKVRAVMSRRDFERSLSMDHMVVALFYEDQKDNRNIRNQNKGLFRMYEDLSTYQPYDDADVIFLKINAGRKDLAGLTSLYDIANMPTFIFFNNGKRLVDEQGTAINLKGFVSRADLQAFIDHHYGTEIKKRVKEKEERRTRIVKSENKIWKQYFYPRDIFVRDYDPAESEKNRE